MERRHFLRTGLGAALAAPGLLTLPQPLAAARRNAGTRADPIRLSSNENPLGVPDSARTAILEAIAIGNRYPGQGAALEAAIARKHGVTADRVLLGAGSTEVLRMVAESLAGPGTRIVVPQPTFEHLGDYAAPFRIDTVEVPLRPDHTMDLDAMRDAARRTRGQALVFLCNPNNPTGTLTSSDDIQAFIESSTEKIMFLVDEAYFDYVEDPGYRSMVPLSLRPNVIVTRTFSKVYGLAGLRVGYGISNVETVNNLRRFANRNNTNALAEAAALGCISDEAFRTRSLDVNRNARTFAFGVLRELELDSLPSHTNFLMHRIRGELQTYIDRMREAGLRVGRPFPPMLGHNRLSVGLPAEMEQWADTLRAFRTKGWV